MEDVQVAATEEERPEAVIVEDGEQTTALTTAAEMIAKHTGEEVGVVLARLQQAATAPIASVPDLRPLDRNGKALTENTRVLIPGIITAVNGDICVVTLEDPMPPYQLTLETKLLVHDGEA
jgi:hypothetical protein